jgi:filamentous hemagglutinin family protein
MIRRNLYIYRHRSLLLAAVGSCLLATPLSAEVGGDGTVTTRVNGQINATCGTGICAITGGTVAGSNLFHSFDRFSVPVSGEARFDTTGVAGVETIISRVTGGLASNIDGMISVVGTSSGANLFLINPNGILFGPNASLNVGGSFIASTASSLIFADGSAFSAVAPSGSPLLTVSAPIGLQYGSNSGPIEVQGPGNNLGFDDFGAFDHSQPSPLGSLAVVPGKTLALVGGAVAIDGGNLVAPSGQIVIGSVGQGTVSLAPSTFGWTVGYQNVSNFGDINLAQSTLLDASGAQGGAIQLQGQNIRVTDGSLIISDTLGSGPSQPITIQAIETLDVSGFNPNSLATSTIITDANPEATGTGGNLRIEAGAVRVTDGGSIATTTYGQGAAGALTIVAPTVLVRGSADLGYESSSSISTFAIAGTGQGGDLTLQTQNLGIAAGGTVATNTFSAGNAGQLTVQADSIALSGESPLNKTPSGLRSVVYAGATGNAGDIAIVTNQLQVLDGASVSASTAGEGKTGDLTINAQNIELRGATTDSNPSGVFSQVTAGAMGKGGNINITTERLAASGGGTISASTFGAGDAGNLTLKAENIQLTGTSPSGFPSGLFAQVQSMAAGNGGNIAVTTNNLQMSAGAAISASTFSQGNTGVLSIKATTIAIDGTSARGNPTGITNQVESGSTGNGRDLSIVTDRLVLSNGAQIGTSTFSSGRAGDLTVQAGTVLLEGFTNRVRSGLFAGAITGTGDGGNLTVVADQLTIQDGAILSVSNFQSRNTLPPGTGVAGNIQVDVQSLKLNRDGRINADSAGGARGNIRLNAADAIILRQGSLISTNARGTATGGNIVVTTPFLVAPARENSDITANAANNRGGQVTVNASGLMGIRFAPQLTPQSDITASSDLGANFNGTVEINKLNIDPNSGLINLPMNLLDPNQQVAQRCEASQDSRFVITGRGGLPASPDQFRSNRVWSDRRAQAMIASNSHPAVAATNHRSNHPTAQPHSMPLIESTGWRRNADGNVELIASATPQPTANIQSCAGTPTAL